MKRLRGVMEFLASRSLTVWIVGLMIFYYLTVAVWAKEAFASFMTLMAGNTFFKTVFILLFVNVLIRTGRTVYTLRREKKKLFLRIPLYSGLIIFLFAFFMSSNVRSFEWKMVGEGDMLDSGTGRIYRVVEIQEAMGHDVIQMEDSGVFKYEPALTIMDRDGIRYEIGAYPPSRVGGLYMHVLQSGIAPGVELIDADKVIAKGYMAMRLTPFGRIDSFEIPPYAYKFYLQILPDRRIRKGSETALHYDLKMPLYGLEIAKGDSVIVKTETETGVSFDSSMKLNFFKPTSWIMLEMVNDPFVVWFLCGILLLLFGGLMYPVSFVLK